MGTGNAVLELVSTVMLQRQTLLIRAIVDGNRDSLTRGKANALSLSSLSTTGGSTDRKENSKAIGQLFGLCRCGFEGRRM